MTLDEFLKHGERNRFEYPMSSPMGLHDEDVIVYTKNGSFRGKMINIVIHRDVGEPMGARNMLPLRNVYATAQIELIDALP